MTSQYFMLSPFEWPWPTCASSCGVVSYWACAKATCIVGVSEPIKVIGCILYPPTCTRLKVTVGYREKKISQSWIIFLLSWQTSYRTKTNELFSQAMCTEIVTNLKLKSFAVVKSWHKAVYQSLYHQWQYLLPNHCLHRPGSSTTEKNVHATNI